MKEITSPDIDNSLDLLIIGLISLGSPFIIGFGLWVML